MGAYDPSQGPERSVVYRPRLVDTELAARLRAHYSMDSSTNTGICRSVFVWYFA